ncbi:CLUMA_CG004796, isoform A [Clunio marinus]|uniref:CLUMA_CG004796, isoform A n=1 Tax=Clunio marinus TaxID=568069 RepID=A0A1J1HUR6_9DIPT|nr:CLUMA_CG004796, isoform A [Clunio marinus]
MANLSKLTQRNEFICASGVAAAAILLLISKYSRDTRRKNLRPEDKIEYFISEKKDSKRVKAHVNSVFFKQLKFLLGIIIPKKWSTETALLIGIAGSLILRSVSDIWMIQNATVIESSIITMNRPKFRTSLVKFLAAMPAIAVVNNVLKWSIGELKIRFRTNLSKYLFEQYLKGYTYYKMTNLDNRIANADQLLTTDIDKFCESVTDLYSNTCKPLLDVFIYIYRTTSTIGAKTPLIIMMYLLFSGVILTHLRRPTGNLTIQEQKLEGEYRYVNSRLITNSEEVAFYQGNVREKLTILASFNKLTAHLRKFLEFRVGMGVVDNLVAKYIATGVGFYAVSLPFFDKNNTLLQENHDGERLRHYYTFGRMLVKLAEAIGRLVLAGREMSRLAGFTTRMDELIRVLKDLNSGKYERTMVSNSASADAEIAVGKGLISFQDNIIRFEKVPLVTPNGDLLVKELSFEVRSGTNVLVCGPNGCGKSSLFRILGELWPSWGGKIVKPPRGKLFYIPQRPYMTLGSLRDQIIYPHTHEEMKRRGKTDQDLFNFLDIVQLRPLIQLREKGLDSIEDWIDVLSGGEKQRVAMARLFYHHPQFAILDECTSAVSVDVEGSMYEYCRKVGITLFTVSHRKSLWTHHEFFLRFDGRGGYEFGKIDGSNEEFGS